MRCWEQSTPRRRIIFGRRIWKFETSAQPVGQKSDFRDRDPIQLPTGVLLPISVCTPYAYLVILLLVIPLPISLRGIFPILDNQILRPVIKSPTEVAVQNVLRALCVPLLRIQTRPAHVRHHGVAAAERVLCVAERVVFGRRLREPDVATVALEVSGFDRFSDVFFDDDGTAGGVHEPGACVGTRALTGCGRFEEWG